MAAPTTETLRELVRWEPPYGVLSVYVSIDPADRGEGWRIELRNELASLDSSVDRDARQALEATSRRVLERFPADAPRSFGRTRVGLVEVAGKPGREEWFSLQLPVSRTGAHYGARPFLRPLIALLDDGTPRGIAAVSAERVRLLRWELGSLEELEKWELEVFSLDWRERKAQRSGDPARVQGAASSGRDQFGQRLEHNRERFLKETGRQAVERIEPKDADVLAFGDPEHVREFAAGGGDRVRACGERNLISVPLGELEAQLNEVIAQLNRERESGLAERIKSEAAGGTRGAVGAQETLEALAEGRVAHLLYDAQREFDSDIPPELDGDDGLPPSERMVELALATSARITPVEGPAADALADVGGVAALLRY